MRCPICDYCPDTPSSVFHSGLSLGRSSRMTFDHDRGEIVCNCLDTEVEYESEPLSIDEGTTLWESDDV